MSDEAKIVDMAEKETGFQAQKKDMDDLIRLANETERAHAMIGAMFVRALEIAGQINNFRASIADKAKTAIIKAGVSAFEVEKYKIDLATGNIVVKAGPKETS